MNAVTVTPAVLSAKEAAAYVGLGRTIFVTRVAPTLSRVRLSAGRVGYRVDDLDKWIDERVEAPKET
jgi:predicted DNA-binding transcriptional regulator AlpA